MEEAGILENPDCITRSLPTFDPGPNTPGAGWLDMPRQPRALLPSMQRCKGFFDARGVRLRPALDLALEAPASGGVGGVAPDAGAGVAMPPASVTPRPTPIRPRRETSQERVYVVQHR